MTSECTQLASEGVLVDHLLHIKRNNVTAQLGHSGFPGLSVTSGVDGFKRANMDKICNKSTVPLQGNEMFYEKKNIYIL